jgi:hypothetical protein
VGILASSIIVRLPAVTEIFLGPDELMVWSIAQGGSVEDILRRALFEVHPPLESFFRSGISTLIDSIQGLRLLYLGICTVGILLCAFAVSGSSSSMAILFLLFILSFSRVFVVSSVLLRAYPLLIFFYGVALFFFSQLVGDSRRPILSIVGMWLSIVLAACCHFSTFLAVPGLFIPVMFAAWNRNDRTSIKLIFCAGAALCVQGILLYLYFFAGDTGASSWRTLSRSDIFSRCAGFTDPGRLTLHILSMFNVSPFEASSYNLLILLGCVGGAVYSGAILFCFRVRRSWFFFATITWSVALLSNQLGLYPITGGKQSILLLFCIAIPIALFFAELIPKKIATLLLPIAAVCIALGSWSSQFSYFQQASDMPLSLTQHEHLRGIIRTVLRGRETMYTSRFGLLYGLFARDGLSTFYMDPQSGEQIASPDGPFVLCAPKGLWQSTKTELTSCLLHSQLDPIFEPDEKIWFLSVGFSDTLFEALRECAAKQGELITDRSEKGFQLFALRRNFAAQALSNTGCLAEYREDHCAKAL